MIEGQYLKHITKTLFSPRLHSARTQRCTYTRFLALFNNLNSKQIYHNLIASA